MKKRLSTFCFALAICLSLAGSLFLGFEKVACDAGQYTALQDRFGLYGEIGVSREEMVPAMEALAAYIRGEAETYNRDVVMFGENRPLFNEKELTHMVDVLGLFRLERAVRTACLAAAAALALLGLWLGRGSLAKRIRRGLLWAFALVTVLAVFVLLAWRHLGFEAIFIGFHRLFFTNDLWLMDYASDAMIRMFPQEFFETLLSLIALRMGEYALICLAFWALLPFLPGLFSKSRTSGECHVLL